MRVGGREGGQDGGQDGGQVRGQVRRGIVAVVVLGLVAGGIAVAGTGPASSQVATATLAPTGDAFVDGSTPATNYGLNARLIVDSSPARESFLRFDLTALTGTVTEARLRIHVADTTDSKSPNGGTVARVNDTTWTETGITYANRPTSWGSTVASIGAVARNTWVDIPVTAAVTAGAPLTLGIRSPNADGAYYDSRQTAATAPQLIVTTDTPSSTSSSSSSTSSSSTSSSTSSTTTTTTTAPPDGTTTTLVPVADAYVDGTNPTVNYGNNARLIVDASPAREFYLRFDLRALSGSVSSARLRLHVANVTDSPSPNGGTVARVDDTGWTETGVTYNTRPTGWGAVLSGIGAVTRDTWVEVPVTSAVVAGAQITLGVRSPNADGAFYDSRQTTATPPQLVVVTTGTPPPPTTTAVAAACAGTLIAGNAGTISDTAIKEPSGIDAGVLNPTRYWVHNDSGDTARIFAIEANGVTQRIYTLTGASAVDWEDIAIGGGPVAGIPYVYVGDIGDNNATRAEIQVYRVPEPTVVPGAATTLAGAEKLRLLYPDGAHNAEALLADPVTGQLVIITKIPGGGPAGIYSAPPGLAAGSVTTLTRVGTLDLPFGTNNPVTGADLSPDGTQLAVRTYAQVLLWGRNPAEPIWAPLASAPCVGPVPPESKGEAIGFTADGRGYLTMSDGAASVLHAYTAP